MLMMSLKFHRGNSSANSNNKKKFQENTEKIKLSKFGIAFAYSSHFS